MPTPWSYIIGVDIGHEDADAIAVVAYNRNCSQSFLVHEDVQKKQGITELAQKIEALLKQYDPDQVVMDTGGLGKKVAEEITKRHSIPIKAAEKVRKHEFIELLNDSMRTQRFMAKPDSAFAQDCLLVEWDLDKSKPDRKVISAAFHSDICDAVLYAFRESLHWLSEPAKEKVEPNTPPWFKEQEEQMERQAALSIQPMDDDPWGNPIEKYDSDFF
jgi:hypothetical protein